MQLLETKYYLFFTDMPINTVGVYVQYLDQMYENLTKAFDFPQGKNIWRGKCPVWRFKNEKTSTVRSPGDENPERSRRRKGRATLQRRPRRDVMLQGRQRLVLRRHSGA